MWKSSLQPSLASGARTEVASRSRLHQPSSASTQYLIAFKWVTSRQVKARIFRISIAVAIRTGMLNRFQLARHPRGQLSKRLSDGCYSTAGMQSSSSLLVVRRSLFGCFASRLLDCFWCFGCFAAGLVGCWVVGVVGRSLLVLRCFFCPLCIVCHVSRVACWTAPCGVVCMIVRLCVCGAMRGVCVLAVAVCTIDVTVVRGFWCYSLSCSHGNSCCSLWRLIVV